MIRAVLKSRNDLVYKQRGVQLGALTILIPVAFILLGTSILKSDLESKSDQEGKSDLEGKGDQESKSDQTRKYQRANFKEQLCPR